MFLAEKNVLIIGGNRMPLMTTHLVLDRTHRLYDHPLTRQRLPASHFNSEVRCEGTSCDDNDNLFDPT